MAARTKLGLSTGQVVLTAVEFAHDNLATLIAESESVPEPSSGLFAGTVVSVPAPTDLGMQCLNIRLLDTDYAVLDRLVAQFRARSRSHLTTVALNAYLASIRPTTKRQRR